ncbi:AAA family ATPase [Mucilaginibacter psychrotolerans]|uniref:LuxR family transcriptional regulator n=1 Tax=Mucilaginibacter psychrotolerans TaxID=1524096 RepID=A0A4Y8SD03_9SPHI|nr:AAA family ATPase [Mucilaginibacter psychrotolerans]TFF36324.1 LuxR family transcriptional regulator [Mucilaginibacter psychrotolerans]
MSIKPTVELPFERPPEIELIRSLARGVKLTAKQRKLLQQQEEQAITGDEAFIIKKADDWLYLPPDQNPAGDMLFGDLWFKGELCILFADTNAGKSILAVQLGDAISRGEGLGDMPVQQQPQPVLYFDFELSAAQFAKRYTGPDGQMHRFSPNFYRVIINPAASRERKFASYHDYLINSFENIIVSTGSRTIIIDNITALRSSTESTAAAVKLMRSLNHIKNHWGLSILVLAHTPKRNPARPITRNDLQGSKMLMNFADSAFAIGESQSSPGLRYLKQVKQRSSGMAFSAGMVKFCRIVKQGSLLHFAFEGQGSETPHLQTQTSRQRKATDEQIHQLHAEGHSVRQIAGRLNCAQTTVFRVIKRVSS